VYIVILENTFSPRPGAFMPRKKIKKGGKKMNRMFLFWEHVEALIKAINYTRIALILGIAIVIVLCVLMVTELSLHI
jgi:hypothetical protein